MTLALKSSNRHEILSDPLGMETIKVRMFDAKGLMISFQALWSPASTDRPGLLIQGPGCMQFSEYPLK